MRPPIIVITFVALAAAATAEPPHEHDELSLSAAWEEIYYSLEEGSPERAIAYAQYALGLYPLDVELNLVYLDVMQEEDLTSFGREMSASWLDEHEGKLVARVTEGAFAKTPALAQKEYKAVLAEDPDFWPARVLLGRLYIKMGKLAEAAKEADVILSQDRGNLRGRALRGEVAFAENRAAEAREDLRPVAEARFYAPRARYLMGLMAAADGHDDEARDWFRAAISQSPNNGEYYYALARALENLGDVSAARLNYEIAAERALLFETAEASREAAARLAPPAQEE